MYARSVCLRPTRELDLKQYDQTIVFSVCLGVRARFDDLARSWLTDRRRIPQSGPSATRSIEHARATGLLRSPARSRPVMARLATPFVLDRKRAPSWAGVWRVSDLSQSPEKLYPAVGQRQVLEPPIEFVFGVRLTNPTPGFRSKRRSVQYDTFLDAAEFERPRVSSTSF